MPVLKSAQGRCEERVIESYETQETARGAENEIKGTSRRAEMPREGARPRWCMMELVRPKMTPLMARVAQRDVL